ncbi:outer membrane beta-barrel protein [Humidesulfovibrio sp.]
MRFYSAAAVLLALCFVALFAPRSVFAADEGKFKIGALYENEQFRNNDNKSASAGGYGGIVLGYEKQQDKFWWAVNGTYQYGRLRDKADYANIAKVFGQGIVGIAYNMDGIMLKPFVGLGIEWEAQDENDHKNFYSTEYVLPVGVRVERNTDVGLFGMDLQFGYVLGREIYGTDGEPYWGRRLFDGSYNVEAGLYYEPANIPVGIRPYFRYEKYQRTKYWSQVERQQAGLEAYVRF